jgi:flavodoxin
MAKILIAYYSRTGHTRTIAVELAARCGADLQEIRDATTKRSGLLGYFRCAREALRLESPPIEPPTVNTQSYDLVILGTPVWASHMSSPMRSFLEATRGKLERIAVFCTQGGNGAPKVIGEIADTVGKRALATLVLNERDVAKGRYVQPLDAFAARISSEVDRRVAATG